jgi:hypothetical protein
LSCALLGQACSCPAGQMASWCDEAEVRLAQRINPNASFYIANQDYERG